MSVATALGSDAAFAVGILALACMLGAYGFAQSTHSSVVFAIAWSLGAIFLFSEGIWPIAAIQAVFALIAFRRYCGKRRWRTKE